MELQDLRTKYAALLKESRYSKEEHAEVIAIGRENFESRYMVMPAQYRRDWLGMGDLSDLVGTKLEEAAYILEEARGEGVEIRRHQDGSRIQIIGGLDTPVYHCNGCQIMSV